MWAQLNFEVKASKKLNAADWLYKNEIGTIGINPSYTNGVIGKSDCKRRKVGVDRKKMDPIWWQNPLYRTIWITSLDSI